MRRGAVAPEGGHAVAKNRKPTAREANRELREGAEKAFGVDDATLRQRGADRRTSAEKTQGSLRTRVWTFLNFWNLWATAKDDENEATLDEEDYKSGWNWIMFVLLMVLVVAVIGVGAYLSLNRSTDPMEALKDSNAPESAAAPGATDKASNASQQSEGATPRRWLIIADTPLHGKRPQFTIELKGDGESGEAVWLEPPQGTGTYEWSGDDLLVKLVLMQTATPGLEFPQHFEVRAARLADGSLSGELLSEDWAYDPRTGLELKGMRSMPAVGEVK